MHRQPPPSPCRSRAPRDLAVGDALLETKLFAPRRRRGLVPRPRLTKLLERGLDAKLTLVSAPPGFGKTSLVADWLAEQRPAWVALDPAENDPVTFWRYVVAALDRVSPGFGVTSAPILESPAPSTDENDTESWGLDPPGAERSVLAARMACSPSSPFRVSTW